MDPEDDNEDEASGMVSTQEGSVSTYSSIVPSDEELLAIGWAKAMDPSSGNYYYFTLDRSKIVWDSPLTTSASEGPVDP